MVAVSSKEATAYLIDPLTAPEPSAETGPGSHFVPPPESASRPRSSSTTNNNPYRHASKHSTSSAHSRHSSRRTPEKFPNYRENALGQLNDTPPSYDAANSPTSSGPGHRRRGSSLKERFPGDESHKPLDILRRDSKKAHRSPHLTKRHLPGADSIDRLDPTVSSVPYHHEGPYDAAGLGRNYGGKKGMAPIDALSSSNNEALRATPVENVKNSVERHVPLDGTAVVPPGQEDRFGRRYEYQEGGNLMIEGDPEGGAYKRWPGVNYHPDDIKGKGEPSYSHDLAMRAKAGGPGEQVGSKSIEMEDQKGLRVDEPGRPRGSSFTQGLKKRIGSLKKKNRDE
ncbi:hypothetical protein KVT40_004617 [Elsinoe batatas]|uniref:Pal1 cell morphology protein n=1 Tax=Elsinoe batatas TaxID=2601811 RepID=A0A8K0PIX8_9PEZI|nr:hypothetical protein KVT40_004617 [Elsinoe batatas]